MVVGDLNVTYADMDRGDTDGSSKSSSGPQAPLAFDWGWFRRWMSTLLSPGFERLSLSQLALPPDVDLASLPAQTQGACFVDALRHQHPERQGAFTWWSTVTAARLTNFGRRLDYTLVSSTLLPFLQDADIQQDVQGSDHCPVWVQLALCGDAKPGPPWIALPPSEASSARVDARGAMREARSGDECTLPDQREGSAFVPPDTSESHWDPQWPVPSLAQAPCPTPALEASKLPQLATVQASIATFFKARKADSDDEVHLVEQPMKSSSVRKRRRGPATLHAFFSGSRAKQARGTPAASLAPPRVVAAPPSRPQPARGSSSAGASWAQLLRGPLPPPKCKHGEAAIQRTVVKAGPRHGARFYVCARPEGRKGDAHARCDFFMWHTAHVAAARKPQPASHPSR